MTQVNFSSDKEPKKARLARLQQSPNFKDGKFQNQTRTEMMAENASFWKIMKDRFSSDVVKSPEEAIPVIKRDLTQPVLSEKLQFTWFGHSSFLLQWQGKNILVDPVFSKRTSPFQFLGPKNFLGTDVYQVEDLPAIDFILISHDHYDHLDRKTIEKLAKKVKQFYVPLGVGAHLQDWGIPQENIKELDWWNEVQITPELFLAATPARHFSGRSLTDRNETLWTSYVLKSRDQSIYLGGDSGYGEHFKQIGEKYGPFDITMLECGQYNTNWPSIHMMPEETAQAHLDLKGKVLMPIHWSKFALALHAWTEPIERLLAETEKQGIVVTTPQIGELVQLDKPATQSHWWQQKSK
ncbi:MBL fold metallo-hydrolase [Adhaeribacter soli]|nr:MBL fold metallo-hydrolase [Adhaeribacter soli]